MKSVAIVAMGARGPGGFGPLQIAMSARGHQFEPRAAPFGDDLSRAASVARCRCLADGLVGDDRFVALAKPALDQALGGSRTIAPLVVALPDADRPDGIAADEQRFIARLAQGTCIDAERSCIVRAGHAGFAIAMAIARRMLFEGAASVVVGGIDSHHHPSVLSWLHECGGLCTEQTSSGRIASEGAAFVRLAMRTGGDRLPRVVAAEHQPGEGDVMARLIKRVAYAGRSGGVEWIVSDVNGEPWRTRAWTDALMSAHDLVYARPHDELVQHIGDVGAATGAALVAIACTLAHSGAVPYRSVLVSVHSEPSSGSHCGVMVLDLPQPRSGFRASVGTAVARAAGRPRLRPTPEEKAQLLSLARGCMEDIGSMGMLCSPSSDEIDTSPYRQRLLDNYDALSALVAPASRTATLSRQELEAAVRSYAAEAPDRARTIARTFIETHLLTGHDRGQ